MVMAVYACVEATTTTTTTTIKRLAYYGMVFFECSTLFFVNRCRHGNLWVIVVVIAAKM
jgi:hypothetical protein